MPQADSKNSSGQEQQITAQTVSNPTLYSQQFEAETIDFYELWITLWNMKWLVIAVTLVAALGSVVYALVTPHVYKAEALLLPPKMKDMQSLNVLAMQTSADGSKRVSVKRITAISVFNLFIQNLNSLTLQKKFIQENGLLELLSGGRTPETNDEDIYEGFAEMIKLEEENRPASLSIELHDPVIAAQWINDLIKFVDKETITMMVEDLRNSILIQIRDIEYTISSKRQMAKQRREDTILRYEEASIIATKLGVMDRVDSTNIVQNNQLNISTTNVPLYFRGYRALNAEISFLKNRISDDPFIGGLRDLQEKLALLRSIKFDEEKMSALHIDRAAYPPSNHIKPNKRLIVSLTTVVGLFSGVFLAFFIKFVQNQSKKHSE
ncbi:Wzz/FepE/Etk N-terminal domain-containing protein [Deltaproteobacteria bacterium]|nr:Wzz/FepE/Etk N-terminal domain-containing protein [Deltaproteobacteria bacterium]